MTSTSMSASELSDPEVEPHLSHEAIAMRAYEIFSRRGLGQGNADEDWFVAERELRHETSGR
ncbi:MAG TPA: DUF2934 domain-containing protein [Polyangia bacterium]|nr:DUF2934 domain-containing protein [Polyangia bacterium]